MINDATSVVPLNAKINLTQTNAVRTETGKEKVFKKPEQFEMYVALKCLKF